jgi:SagB-type dehydrogenase family enzyme
MTQYRTSRAVILNRFDDGLFGFNLANKSAFALDANLLQLLDAMSQDKTTADLAEELPDIDPDGLKSAIEALVEIGAVVEAGTEAAAMDETLTNKWLFGPSALALHFTTRDMEFITAEESETLQLEHLNAAPSPPLRIGLRDSAEIINLPDASQNDVVAFMAKRRTVRIPKDQSISIDAIGDILFAGFGIVGETRNVTGNLPLKMTPSGGARNPYEAYLIARKIDGLEPGVYHYCGLAHAMQKVNDNALPPLGSLVGGQEWANGMAAMVVLVAHFERTMWKYRDGNAYRVVLIEAGHIGQNIALAATSRGLTACPTAALSHSRIESLLGIDNPLVSSIYALAVCVPANDSGVTLYSSNADNPFAAKG